MKQIRISAKDLGSLALPNFCARCFWITRHCPKLPFQIFPGIFNSIDAYTKKVTKAHFARYNQLPSWLRRLGDLGKPLKVPHHSKFYIVNPDAKILLTGTPDEIIKSDDGKYFIIDYKTAKFTEKQDSLLPQYEVQLNAYAYIAERTGFQPINGIALVYMEPQTELSDEEFESMIQDKRFLMGFAGHVLPLDLNPEKRIPPLLNEVRRIYDLESPPSGNEDCKNCERLDDLIMVVRGRPLA